MGAQKLKNIFVQIGFRPLFIHISSHLPMLGKRTELTPPRLVLHPISVLHDIAQYTLSTETSAVRATSSAQSVFSFIWRLYMQVSNGKYMADTFYLGSGILVVDLCKRILEFFRLDES